MRYKGKLIYPVFHALTTPVARKAWICKLCGEPVEVGQRYARYIWRRETGVYGQQAIDDLPFHPVCWSVVTRYCKMNKTKDFSMEAVMAWIKTRNHCKRCIRGGETVCHISTCEKTAQYVHHKPIQTYYDKLKSLDE